MHSAQSAVSAATIVVTWSSGGVTIPNRSGTLERKLHEGAP